MSAAQTCLVVMYHYVRDSAATPFPEIRALPPAFLEQQLEWLQAHHTVVDPQQVVAAFRGEGVLPASAATLTFDDGFIDHYAAAYPILRARGLRGVFFVTHDAIGAAARVLPVHKIHFLLAALGSEAFGRAVLRERDLEAAVAAGRHARVFGEDAWEHADERAIKNLLNYELPFEVADGILDTLFARHIGDERAFARTLYLDEAMIAEMAAAGMTFGYHTRSHRMLARLSPREQAQELSDGVAWIRGLTGQAEVPFCYPWGGPNTYTADTLRLLDDLGYAGAFNTVRRSAVVGRDGRFEVPRLDTRDLPPYSLGTANRMTDALQQAPEFQHYLRVRDAVLRIKTPGSVSADAAGREGGAGADQPSDYWAEELENIDYLIEASPLVIRKLRQHAFHITGIRPYDYRSKHDSRREMFEARLQALRALGGDDLLVPESPALGGFGYDIGGRLFNVDTLKFYEVLIGMQRAGVLDTMRGLERPVVCEVGAGWGGFAYQFKTLLPRTTYVIVDFPELFLFSATYLGALFPSARMLFCGDGGAPSLDGRRDADFVFVPHTEAPLVSSLPLDLTVNMVSFQEMTDAQVRGYADMAADAGCPLLYSLNRERSPYNEELTAVSHALAERYRLTEVSVLGTDYTSAMKKPPKPGARASERSELSYRHLVGRLDRSSAHETAGGTAPAVVLGMTLYNNARHLPEAIESLLAQTAGNFGLLLLDDASGDETESIARAYAARDPRVRYVRHDSRRAMIATWHEVAELAAREWPSARYFAWTSDHDRWHPRWLERMLSKLEADPEAVLAYPITRRMSPDGQELDKGPRLFDTASCGSLAERWHHFCRHGVGAGDMVYGLIRLDALRKAGIFRRVLRPDRLLVAELTLQGRIRQVPEVLWFRRQSAGTSIERQRHTLVLAGEEPSWFWAPPWLQHSIVLWQEYVKRAVPPVTLPREEWVRMLLAYQLRYGWRHFRKTETSHALGRAINGAEWGKKLTRHYARHAVYNTLVTGRMLWGKSRRLARRAVYEVLMFTHRTGLRKGDHA